MCRLWLDEGTVGDWLLSPLRPVLRWTSIQSLYSLPGISVGQSFVWQIDLPFIKGRYLLPILRKIGVDLAGGLEIDLHLRDGLDFR